MTGDQSLAYSSANALYLLCIKFDIGQSIGFFIFSELLTTATSLRTREVYWLAEKT